MTTCYFQAISGSVRPVKMQFTLPSPSPPDDGETFSHHVMICFAINNRIYRIHHRWGRHLCCISISSSLHLSTLIVDYRRKAITISTGFVFRETQNVRPYKQSAPNNHLTIDRVISWPGDPGPSDGRGI